MNIKVILVVLLTGFLLSGCSVKYPAGKNDNQYHKLDFCTQEKIDTCDEEEKS